MRKIAAAALFVAALVAPSQLSARVAPLTPEQKLMLDRHFALENAFRARFSDGAFNVFRDLYGSVIVAEERDGRPGRPRALAKDEHGWFELTESGRRKLPKRVAHELDRLMIDGNLWAETPYVKDAPCSRPQLFILRYAGNEKFGRQCAPSGLAGRLAQVAATLRVPPGRGVTTAPPPTVPSLGPQEDMAGIVGNRSREMIYAWERRSLAGAVDPYAEDVIVEFADGRVLRGRRALVEWMRPQQDWSTPGLATPGVTKGVQWHRSVIKAPEDGFITEMREIRWVEGGRPLRRTYSATWANNDGVWQIAHERVSEDKPATDARIPW